MTKERGDCLEYLSITDYNYFGMDGFLSLSNAHIYKNCTPETSQTTMFLVLKAKEDKRYQGNARTK